MKNVKGVVVSAIALLVLSSGLQVKAEANTTTVSTDDVPVVQAGEIIEKQGLKGDAPQDVTYEELSDEYNLRDASPEDIPEGTVGINVESEEELAIVLENLSLEPEVEFEGDIINHNGISPFATAIVKKREKSQWIGSAGKLNIAADFHLEGSGSFYSITKVKNIRTFASGFTFPFNYKQIGTPYSKIASGKQSATAYASGNVEYLLFVKGIGKWYERTVDQWLTYNIGR